MVKMGIVRFIDTMKGYGVIKVNETNEEFLVHIENVINPLKNNDLVEFEVEKIKGRLEAVRVRII